jgi:antitoxin HicB
MQGKQMDKTIEYYLGLPYTIRLIPETGGGWFVEVAELQGCMSEGTDPDDAIAMIRDAMRCWLEVALEDGLPIPEPRELEQYSGKFVVRVPRWLHRELVRTTDQEGVSLNQFVSTALARAVGEHASSVERAATRASAAAVASARLEAARSSLTALTASLRRGDATDALRLAEELGSQLQAGPSGAVRPAGRQEPVTPSARKPRKDERKQSVPSPGATYVISPQTTTVCLADSDRAEPARDAAPAVLAGT